ncbi:MAG: simple sugar transport system ATP-binding protein [Spirochaetes bacterium]|nr:MAG: simple sugar transport system ATP-binding protein [Spirochaetota bacterium]
MQCVSLVDIDKTYPFSNSQANCKARLEILAGEIHAVVGENGAGKTTLMKILSGMYAPDGGSILIDGKPVSFASPADACALGIGMVHQHFAIIPGITAAENIVFGSEPRKGGIFIHPRRSLEEAKKTVERFGFSLDPDKPADLLTVGERQQVEILRQLHKDCRLLILDEPTSVLTEHEIRAFFSTLQELKTKGRTIVVISHKVREVMEISDSVTVMRDGRTLGEFKTAEMDEKRLSDLMMGSEEPLSFPEDHRHSRHEEAPRGPDVLGRDVLSFHRVGLARRHKGLRFLHDLSFTLKGGEILGFCGIAGNGLSELEDLLAGFVVPSEGQMLYLGGSYPGLRKAPWNPRGIGYVPSDRMRRGASLDNFVWENLIAVDRDRFFPRGILNRLKAENASRKAIEAFHVKAEPANRVRELSGGNIQKLILSRELSSPPPSLCVLCEPTWGLDIATTRNIYQKILEAKKAGSAILLISSNLDEIIGLSDRIAILHKGRMVGEVSGSLANREHLGAMMLGLSVPVHGKGGRV